MDNKKEVENVSRRSILKYGLLSVCATALPFSSQETLAANPRNAKDVIPDILPTNPVQLMLPEPSKQSDMSLMEALTKRQSTRQFTSKPITPEILSTLLWTAWGYNRADKRTIPTSRNNQSEILYVVWDNSIWIYDATANKLIQVSTSAPKDIVEEAPLTLVFTSLEEYYASGMHVGSMYQNVGLYCASVGLGNVVKLAGVDTFNKILKLPNDYKVIMTQRIGWPA